MRKSGQSFYFELIFFSSLSIAKIMNRKEKRKENCNMRMKKSSFELHIQYVCMQSRTQKFFRGGPKFFFDPKRIVLYFLLIPMAYK